MEPRRRNYAIGSGLTIGAIVLVLFQAGDADLFGFMVPVWLIGSVGFALGLAVSYLRAP